MTGVEEMGNNFWIRGKASGEAWFPLPQWDEPKRWGKVLLAHLHKGEKYLNQKL